MGKNKYDAPNNSISEYIYNDYIYDSDLCKPDMLNDKIDILISNNLAYRITGTDYLDLCNELTYRVACKFICKYNKYNRNYRRKLSTYEFGGKKSIDQSSNKELLDLTTYSLCEGTYYCQMDDKNYAKLVVELNEVDSMSQAKYEFYLIGKKWRKWKDVFYDMVSEYEKCCETSKDENIYYTDGRPSVSAIFKPFDQVILKDKERLLRYIDNFVDNIPVYYNKYNMISKLSIILYGKPGTGKSTVARAIAKHLGITSITSIGPDYFDSPEEGRRGGRRGYNSRSSTVYTIDDIDCICKSREDTDDRENSEIMSTLLSFLDNPPTFYFKAKDGVSYPISIVIATTNYYDKLDSAVKRYGRFDLKIEMNEFDRQQAEEMCKLYDLRLKDLVRNSDRDGFTISPSYLQALCLENVDKSLKKIN